MADQRTTVAGADRGLTVVGQDIYEESSTQKHKLGERLVIGERVFRYCKNGATALVAGYVIGSPATVTVATSGSTSQVATVGNTEVTLVVTGLTAGADANGYMLVTLGTGLGQIYKIKDNDLSGSSTTKFYLYDALATTLTTTSEVSIMPSAYKSVIVCPTDAIIQAVGVPIIDISTASYYFWAQTWGPCACYPTIATGNTASARALVLSSTTAGALRAYTVTVANTATAADNALMVVAEAMLDSTAYTAGILSPVYLRISP